MEACIIDQETVQLLLREVRETLTLLYLAYNGIWQLEIIERKETEAIIGAVTDALEKLDIIISGIQSFNLYGMSE